MPIHRLTGSGARQNGRTERTSRINLRQEMTAGYGGRAPHDRIASEDTQTARPKHPRPADLLGPLMHQYGAIRTVQYSEIDAMHPAPVMALPTCHCEERSGPRA
jgi:hypothetical protein